MSYDKTKASLNQLVADLSQFSAIIHQTHWYMVGEEFLTMHPKMDEFMDEINEQLDEVAERLITMDGYPFSTLTEFAENTRIPDETGTYKKTIREQLDRLLEGYRYLRDTYNEGIEAAASEDDKVTEDLLIGFKGAIEKKIWMVSATLGRTPRIGLKEKIQMS